MQRIVTVSGDVSPDKLGVTLTHEHLSMDFDCCFFPPKEESNSKLEWKLENAGFIRQNPYSHTDNLVLNDADSESAVLDSVSRFARAGGGCIVENSTVGLHRKTAVLVDIAKKTGVHIVAGTGYYVVASQDKDTLSVTEEQMSAHMTGELSGDGCVDLPGVHAGLVGEIGCTWPLHDFEKKTIRASASVQESLGCAVSFHPGRHPDAPFEILRIFQEAGGKADKTIISHMERTILDTSVLSDFAALGCYCQYDLFGTECSYYQFGEHIDFPSDAQRMDHIAHLVREEGRGDRVLMAHDIHTKHRLERYGGHGFVHILENAVPKMLRQKGLTREQLDKILIHNPARVLAYKK